MSDWWGTLQATIGGAHGSILVDLGIRDQVPDRSRPMSIRVRVPLRNPRPDGLWTSEEGPALEAIERSLPHVFRTKLDAVYVGRATTNGVRDFYLYAPTKDGLNDAVAELSARHPEYQFRAATAIDAEWSTYLTFLYPDPLGFQLMLSEETVDELRELGDDGSLDRELIHWANFPAGADLNRLLSAAREQGFEVRPTEADTSSPTEEACVVIRGMSKGSRDGIQKAVVSVFHLVAEHGGQYDGFESPVVRPVDDSGTEP